MGLLVILLCIYSLLNSNHICIRSAQFNFIFFIVALVADVNAIRVFVEERAEHRIGFRFEWNEKAYNLTPSFLPSFNA